MKFIVAYASSRKTSSSRGSKEKEPAPLSIDYVYLSRLCLKYWQWLAGAIVGGAVAGFVYASFQIPIYAAQSTIFVQAKDVNAPAVGEIGQMDDKSADLLKTFEQLLQTRNLVDRVVKSERLNENQEFMPKGITAPVTESTASDMLAGDVTIRIRQPTRLIDITVRHPSAKMAQLLANRLAHESILQEFDQKGFRRQRAFRLSAKGSGPASAKARKPNTPCRSTGRRIRG